MSQVEALTKDNFHAFIQQPFVVVDFWASWCGPCRALAPILEKIAQENNILIGKMSIEEESSQTFSDQYQVLSIPTLLFFKAGRCVGRSVGFVEEQALLAKIQAYANE